MLRGLSIRIVFGLSACSRARKQIKSRTVVCEKCFLVFAGVCLWGFGDLRQSFTVESK